MWLITPWPTRQSQACKRSSTVVAIVNCQSVHCLQSSVFSDATAKQCASELHPDFLSYILCSVHKYACQQAVAWAGPRNPERCWLSNKTRDMRSPVT